MCSWPSGWWGARMPVRVVPSWGGRAKTLHPVSYSHWTWATLGKGTDVEWSSWPWVPLAPEAPKRWQLKDVEDINPNSWGNQTLFETGSEQWYSLSTTPFLLKTKNHNNTPGNQETEPEASDALQEYRARQSSLHMRPLYTHTPVSKYKGFLGESITLFFWLGIPCSFSFLSRASEPFQHRQFYLWYLNDTCKEKEPSQGKMRSSARDLQGSLMYFLLFFRAEMFIYKIPTAQFVLC